MLGKAKSMNVDESSATYKLSRSLSCKIPNYVTLLLYLSDDLWHLS